MPNRLLLVLILAISLTAFAQVSAPPRQDSSTPATVVPPTSNGVVLTGYGPAGGVLLTTPEATFDSPLPTAGISLAGRAGISDTTPINTGVQSTLNSSTMVYVNMPATTAIETVNPATSAVSSSTNDLLPSYFSNNIGGEPNLNGLSLAEIAARYRSRQGTQTARTYTNADVPNENAGTLTNILLAENRLPARLRTAAAPSAVTQAQSAGTDTTAQAQPRNENKLPTSASILPLLGFLGLASGGLGVLLRRYRR